MLEDSFIGLLFDINFAGLEDWVFQPNNNLRGSNVDRSFTQDVQRKSFIASSY